MIHINLLPVRQIRERLRVRDEIAVYLASVIVLLVSLSLIGLNKISILENLQGENLVLTQKKASYKSILNEITKLEKDKKTQETKLNVIKELKHGSRVSVRVLDEIARLTPSSRLWLKSLTMSGGKLKIAGVALDNATIAQFMNGIYGSDFFSGAELAGSAQTVIAGAKLKSFSLQIAIKSLKDQRAGKK